MNIAEEMQQQPQTFQEPKPQTIAKDWKPEVLPNPKHEQEKMAHELKEHSKVQQESKVHDEIKSAKIEKHSHISHDHDVRYSVAEKLKMDEIETLDGIAEAPGGAILSLTLGNYQ